MSESKAEAGKSPEVVSDTDKQINSVDRKQVTKRPKRRNAKRRLNYALDKLQQIENETAKLEGRVPKDVSAEHFARRDERTDSVDSIHGGQNSEHGSDAVVDDSGIIDAEIVEVSDLSGSRVAEIPLVPLPVHVPKIVQQQSDSNQTSESDDDYVNPYPHKSEDWWQHSKPEVQQARCRAHTTSGDRCRSFAINGARVCRLHGGAAPHVKAAARTRLENASDSLAQRLLGMTFDSNVKDSVKLAAIKDALDRAGLKAPEQVVISPGQQRPFEEIADDIQFSTMTREQSRAMRGYVEPDSVASQYDSDSWNGRDSFMENGFGNSPTAPVGDDSRPERADHDGHSDRPAARRPDRQAGQDRQYPSEVFVTGEDAIRAANDANRSGDDRPALPPGRSARY